MSDGLQFGTASERRELSANLDRLERMLNRLTAYLRARPTQEKKKDAP